MTGHKRSRAYRSLENIDLRSGAADVRAIGVDGARMRLALAGAARQTLTRQEREDAALRGVSVLRRGDGETIQSLIGDRPDVARVVCVRPL